MIHIIDLKFLGVEQAIASYLIETEKGPILIETGPYSTFKTLTNCKYQKLVIMPRILNMFS